MVVLGIDPGSTVTGLGVVRQHRGRVVYVASDTVRTSPDMPMAARLARIHAGVSEAITRHAPEAVAIEAIFAHKSATSALVLGQARGVALLAAAQLGFEPFEYNNATVKRSVGAHGKADKAAIAKMVRMLLGVDVPGPADATDALAIAITHCAHARSHALGRIAR